MAITITINYNDTHGKAVRDAHIEGLYGDIEGVAAISQRKQLAFTFANRLAVEKLAMAQHKNKSGHKWVFLNRGVLLKVENGIIVANRLTRSKSVVPNLVLATATAADLAVYQ